MHNQGLSAIESLSESLKTISSLPKQNLQVYMHNLLQCQASTICGRRCSSGSISGSRRLGGLEELVLDCLQLLLGHIVYHVVLASRLLACLDLCRVGAVQVRSAGISSRFLDDKLCLTSLTRFPAPPWPPSWPSRGSSHASSLARACC